MTRLRSPFGARLEYELSRVGSTQQQFATQIGVSQQTVSKWITGETTPRLRHVPRIETLLDVHPGTLSSLLFAPPEALEPNAARVHEPASMAGLQRKIGSLTSDELAKVDLFIDEIFHHRP